MEEYKSKSYQKLQLKNFWKRKWVPGRSIETWQTLLISKTYATNLIHKALEKLELEKAITPEERTNMLAMLKGGEEDVYLTLSLMQNLKPKAFSRRDKSKTGRPVKEKTTYDDVRNRFFVSPKVTSKVIKYK